MNHEKPIIKNKEWIGRIPSDWDFVKIKEHFVERNTKVDDISFPPLSVSMGGVIDQMENVSKSDNSENRKLVKKNDFVINSRSDRKGSSGISPRDGSVSLINIVLKPKNINPKYSEYLFKSYYFKEEFFRNGKGIHLDLWSTRYELMKQIFIPYPKIEEQNKIVEYLDNETHQIEKLTKKIEQKIELLKEQRTSLINEVVTKGLNPDVEMKDSGIEWIGEIPSHWETTKLKYKGNVIIGLSFTPDDITDENNGTLVLRSSNVQGGKLCLEDTVYVNSDISKKLRTRENDILICSRNGSRKLIGKNCLISKDVEGSTWGVFMSIYRCESPVFFYWLLNSSVFKSQSGLFLTSTINQLTVSTLENMLVPYVSDLNEQKEIVKYLEIETQRIDETIFNEEKRIQLLKEYKQSLISEVVTGKKRVV